MIERRTGIGAALAVGAAAGVLGGPLTGEAVANPGYLDAVCVDRDGNGTFESVQRTIDIRQMDSRLAEGRVTYSLVDGVGTFTVNSASGNVTELFEKSKNTITKPNQTSIDTEANNIYTGQVPFYGVAKVITKAPEGVFTAYTKLTGVDNGTKGVIEQTKTLECFKPAPKPEETPKTAEPTVEVTTPVKVRVPIKPKNNPPKVTIDKVFEGGRTYKVNGQTVERYGDVVRRVSPGEIFNMRIKVSSLDDGDKIKGEKVVVTWSDQLPRVKNIALMLAKGATSGKFDVQNLGGKFTLREGQSRTVNVPVTTTLEAARPPRMIDNCAYVKIGGQPVDKDCATIFDPIDPFKTKNASGSYATIGNR